MTLLAVLPLIVMFVDLDFMFGRLAGIQDSLTCLVHCAVLTN